MLLHSILPKIFFFAAFGGSLLCEGIVIPGYTVIFLPNLAILAGAEYPAYDQESYCLRVHEETYQSPETRNGGRLGCYSFHNREDSGR